MKNAPTITNDSRGIANQHRNAITTKPSLRSAINAKCRECIYCPLTGTGSWRQQVAACTSINCALFDVRPKPTSNTTEPLAAPKNPENGHFDPVLNCPEG